MRFLISAITRLIEAWGKRDRFSQVTLILVLLAIGSILVYLTENFKSGNWLVKCFLVFLLYCICKIADSLILRSHQLENSKLQEQNKEKMQKNKDLNT